MCTLNNLFNIKMEARLTILGISSFILSSIAAGTSLYVVITEEHYHTLFQSTHNLRHVFNFDLDTNIIDLVAGIVCVIFTLAMVFSVLLIVGMRKNKPGFVVAYFGYGIMLTILLILSAILEILQYYWSVAIPTLIFSAFYIWCLIYVHSVYDLMQKGLKFGSNRHNVFENEL